jgi:uncharacterized protein YecE (DUF72 family)
MTTAAPDSPTAPPIAVGIAGWSYADWNGTVYPRGTKDKLRYVAPYVDVIEVNSSFYHLPTTSVVASWQKRCADLPRLRFTAKLPQSVTHQGEVDAAAGVPIADAVRPHEEPGQLTHRLAQFRYDFDDTSDHRERLRGIADHFRGPTTLALELRHRSWQSSEALSFLNGLAVTVANLDYPTAADSFDLAHCNIGEHAYLRLHGRNAKAWFDGKAGRDATYDYRYSNPEIEEIAGRALRITGMSKSLTLIANNHFKGKELAAAIQLKQKLSGGQVEVPPLLARTYPDLDAIRKPEHDVHDLF